METATSQPAPRAYRVPFWARVIALLYASVGALYAALFLMFVLQDLSWSADFSGFYTGWTLVVNGAGERLYDYDLQRTYQTELLDGQNSAFPNGMLRFNYPPHTAVLLAPLALLPLEAAYLLWAALQVFILVVLLSLFAKLAHDWQPHERILLLSGVVAFSPLLNNFILGAFSLWTLLCAVLFYRALKREQEGRAGIWLAFGTIKPQNVFSLSLLALGGRRWRLLGAGLAVGLVMAAITGLATYWLAWLDFLRAVTAPSISSFPDDMYNVRGTLTLLLGAEARVLISRVSLLALGLTTLLMLWLWRGPWRPDAPDFEPRLALTMCLGMLCSPHHYPHDSLMYILPAMLLYQHVRTYRPREVPVYATFVLSMPLLFFVTEFVLEWTIGIRLPVVAALVLTGWAALALRSQSVQQHKMTQNT